jgi:N-acetylmuramoyl-L-alanine amidase
MHINRRFNVLIVWLFVFAFAPILAAGKTVVIDAGHGGHDRGGMPNQRIPEKGYALDVAQRLQRVLAARGYQTVMTRNGDYFVGLRQRCEIANRYRGAVFVSIHFNGAPREGANGIETYYYSARSSRLAHAIHGEVMRVVTTEDRRVRQRGFFVLRHTTVPSVLCELGFLTNRAEAKLITSSPAYRQRLAEAVGRGVMRVH